MTKLKCVTQNISEKYPVGIFNIIVYFTNNKKTFKDFPVYTKIV